MKMTWSNLTCLGGVNTFWVVLSCDSRPQPQTEITDFAALPYRAGEPLSFFVFVYRVTPCLQMGERVDR